MAELRKRKIDSKAINDGDWVGAEYGSPIPGWDDLCLKVRGLGSAAFREIQNAKHSKATLADREDDGTLRSDVGNRLYREALAEVILLDWKNVTDGGRELPFSPGECLIQCVDPDNEPFRDAIIWASQHVSRVRDKVEKKIEKN